MTNRDFLQIDSHAHCWQLSRGDYDWLTPDLTMLYQDFLPKDLEFFLKQCDINAVMLVQAAATLAETNYLLSLAEKYSFILGVVGWVDLLSENAIIDLAELAKHPKFFGIRPMIQDIPQLDWMLRQELTPGLLFLQEKKLTFDALLKPEHLPYFIKFLDRYPQLKIVIDHGAKPNIKNQVFQPWANHMKTIAEFPNVYCKLSGLLTECDKKWSLEMLLPYLNHLFAIFGYKRIMWGSDFPVLTSAGDYVNWYQLSFSYVESNIGHKALPFVFGKTAEKFYQK